MILKNVIGTKYIAAVGDSKCASPSSNWQFPLITLLEGHTSNKWLVGFTHATAGWTVANAQSGLATALTTVGSNIVPTYVFVDLGVNDSVSMPSQSTFESNYGSILDQLHTKWPNAFIYVAKVWRGSQVANCSTLNGWIDNILSTRSWVTLGMNETTWLDSWDGGDNVHPSVSGYWEMARQWRAGIGF